MKNPTGLRACVNARLFLCLVLFVFMAGVAPAFSVDIFQELEVNELAYANPDECYMGKGSENNNFQSTGLTSDDMDQCEENGGILKTNRGYLWGLTSSGDSLWFGTGSNIVPVGFGAILDNVNDDSDRDLEALVPALEFSDIVLEFAKSTYKNGELGLLGDYRPPRMYAYSIGSQLLTDITPDDPLVEKTFGIRSAAYFNGVVLLAGPYMDKDLKGINIFAYNAQTKEFIGSTCLRSLSNDEGAIVADGINNIRKWLVVNDILYTTIGTASGGNVLRWKGSLNNPFTFDVVGTLENQGTDLVYHDNRLFVFTWPPSEDYTGVSIEVDTSKVCDIIMTKNEIPTEGLTAGTEFVKVWSVSDYEPDTVTASTYGLGAAASFGGYLYWGTMHVPLAGGASQIKAHPGEFNRPFKLTAAFFKSNRQSAVFRGRNLASDNPEIELLYGEDYLYRYLGDGDWESVPNNMNATPLYGSSGFGSRTNFYLWSMKEYKGQLYVGMFDGSFPEDGELLSRAFNMFLNYWIDDIPNTVDAWTLIGILSPPDNVPGADLYRFPDTNSPAVAETMDCFGYQGAYGFRNLIVVDDTMYAGTASSFNLHPDGGWKVLELKKEDPSDSENESILDKIRDLFRR